MISPSDIVIELDGVDITRRVVFSQSRFMQSANPMQGTFQVVCRDLEHDFAPPMGRKLTCLIDGKPMFGGYLLRIGRGNWFDAGDGSDPSLTRARKWTLSGPDFNVMFDKRVLHDPANHFSALVIPGGSRTLSEAVVYLFDNFIDVIPGLNHTAFVDDISDLDYASENGLYVQQGSYLRAQMDDFAKWGAIIYYLMPNATVPTDIDLHFHEYENITKDWGFSDAPDQVATIGFREGMYEADFTEIVTEALVWGGSSLTFPGPAGDVVFSKYPKPPAADKTVAGRLQSEAREQDALDRIDTYGRWQMAEMNIGQDNYLTQASVHQRSFIIINGPSGTVPIFGIEGGFNKPTQRMSAVWHAHQVPGGDHVRAGEVMDFTLYSQEPLPDDPPGPLVASLPLRSLTMSFPTIPGDNPGADTLTYVRFEGEFGTSYSDNRHLWKYIRRQRRRALRRL